jgi:hypothetical protein
MYGVGEIRCDTLHYRSYHSPPVSLGRCRRNNNRRRTSTREKSRTSIGQLISANETYNNSSRESLKRTSGSAHPGHSSFRVCGRLVALLDQLAAEKKNRFCSCGGRHRNSSARTLDKNDKGLVRLMTKRTAVSLRWRDRVEAADHHYPVNRHEKA